MAIEITIRHQEIGDAIKTQAAEKAARLDEKFPGIEFIRAVLDKDGPFFTVAVAVQGSDSTVEGSGKKPGVMEALQDAFDKAEAQLRKNAQKIREIRKQEDPA